MRIPQRAEGTAHRDHGRYRRGQVQAHYAAASCRSRSAAIPPSCTTRPASSCSGFTTQNRGDIILNPLDARCPYWGPSEELRRRAEAKAIAASLYQPTTDKKGEFFTETPQKIFAHLLTFGPTPQELVEWMANPDEIDRRVQNTEMAMMIAKGAPAAAQRRSGLTRIDCRQPADAAHGKTKAASHWTATEWAENRRGWIFITSQAERARGPASPA